MALSLQVFADLVPSSNSMLAKTGQRKYYNTSATFYFIPQLRQTYCNDCLTDGFLFVSVEVETCLFDISFRDSANRK